ncbi:zinc metalloprotease [Spirosoma sordidisoli]|uniref:M50 family peptidase n=1 Tax=Spirosoma sordidisoli TaxID=2502893 RepID=A0A4Q2UG06_9BACT|nr:hypothetical protein [Spirosoma sordidisoli]RYC68227.1 hypothetical protein EQG79_22535 [Spirosoma sordidisoli]
MLITPGTSIHEFDKSNWVIHSAEGRNFLVNEATFRLYNILATAPGLSEAKQAFDDQFGLNLDLEQFKAVLAKSLGGYNVLVNDEVPTRPVLTGNYLKLKVEFMPAWLVHALSKPFQWLYDPAVFWIAFLICASVVPVVYLVAAPDHVLAKTNYGLYLGLLYATMIVHELGHIGACARCGLKHGGVGFGFYFIMPVMYADITEIWLANRSRRIIANLAGVFNEVLYASILALVYWLTGNETYLAVALTVVTMVAWQFNPFVRFDGYWVLSDLTNTPNLLQKANDTFQRGTRWPALKAFVTRPLLTLRQTPLRHTGLFAYALLNTLLWVSIMLYTFIVHRETVLHFPAIVWHLFNKAMDGQLAWTDISRKYLTVLLFYILLIRFAFLRIRQLNLRDTMVVRALRLS